MRRFYPLNQRVIDRQSFNPHPNLSLRFLHFYFLPLSDKSIRQQAFVARLREDVRVEYDGVVAFGIARRAGDAAGVAFSVQACAEVLRGAVVARVHELRILLKDGAQIKQGGLAVDAVDFAFGDDRFFRFVPACVGDDAVEPMMDGFIYRGGDAVAAVPDAETAVGVARLLPVFEWVANGVVPVGGLKGAVNHGCGGLKGRWFDVALNFLRQRPIARRVGQVVK